MPIGRGDLQYGGSNGGDRGIRTLDRALQPYNGLANRRLQPLGHISVGPRYARPGAPSQGSLVPGHAFQDELFGPALDVAGTLI